MQRSLPCALLCLAAATLGTTTLAACGDSAEETLPTTTTTTTHVGGSGGIGGAGATGGSGGLGGLGGIGGAGGVAGAGATAGNAGTGGLGPCPGPAITDHAVEQNAGEQIVPKIETVADGSSWVAWYSNEQNNYDVRAQLIDAAGNPLLGDHGLLVSGHPSDTWVSDFSLVTDHEQAAIVAFQDIRSGHFDVVAYRIGQDGSALWGADGIAPAPSTLDGFFPKAVVTSSNDVVLVWERFNDTDTVHELVLQRVGPDGTLRWGNGIAIQGAEGQIPVRPWIVGTGPEDVIVVWEETPDSMSLDRTLKARRLDAQSAAVWNADTIISSGQQVQFFVDPVLEPDDAGGVYVAWPVVDGNRTTAYLQHIEADGAVTMPAGGVAVTTSTTTQQYRTGLAWVAASQELVTAWKETDLGQIQVGLRAQRFTSTGNMLWPADGLELVALSDTVVDLAAVRALDDRAVLFEGEWSFGNFDDLRMLAGVLELTASPTWAPEVLSDVQSGKQHPAVASKPSCTGLWMAWADLRADLGDIYGGFLVAP